MDTAPPPTIGSPDMGRLAPVVAYWQSLRRGRPAPARTELDPAALHPWLSASAIVERDEAGRVRFRLGGRVIAECLGAEPRGLPLRALFAPAARDRLADLTACVFDGPQLLRMVLVTERGAKGAPVDTARCVLLPLSDGEGRISRALVCLDLDPRADVGPICRLDIVQAHLTLLGKTRLRAVGLRRSGRPELRLIKGGRA